MTSSFSSGVILPCIRPTLRSGNTISESCSCIACAAFIACVSDSSITGYTTYACRPSSTCFFMKLYTCSTRSSITCLVRIGLRPGGSSSMIDVSRSP